MHAYAIDGLDPDKREEIETLINADGTGAGDEKAKARRERAAVATALSRKG